MAQTLLGHQDDISLPRLQFASVTPDLGDKCHMTGQGAQVLQSGGLGQGGVSKSSDWYSCSWGGGSADLSMDAELDDTVPCDGQQRSEAMGIC